MSDRSLVLVVSNDSNPTTARISRHLVLALNRLGHAGVCRDTRLIRWAISAVEKESSVRREAYETAVAAKWNKFIFDYGFDTIISVDLHWFFTSKLFVDDPRVRRIHSFWFGDLQSHLESVPMFPLEPKGALELINLTKISHHCPDERQAEALRKLGVKQATATPMPASMDYADADQHFWDECLRRALA